MCDQTTVNYIGGDVVWTKIRSVWWPGVVQDVENNEQEKDLLDGLKWKPIATVKFFDEEKYEFVKKLDHIYHYNCRRKDEFIKKGLDKYRTGAQYMAKFPEDIKKAEALVKGDIDIVHDPKFAPSPKTNYSDIFGSKKKGEKKTDDKLSSVLNRRPTPCRQIIPMRQKYRGPITGVGAVYNCPFCAFTSLVINNISLHVSMVHANKRIDYAPPGYSTEKLVRPYTEHRKTSKPRISSPAKKKKQLKSPEVKRANVSQAKVSQAKVSQTNVAAPVVSPPVVSAVDREKKKKFTDALLADWSDDDQEIRLEGVDSEQVPSGDGVAETDVHDKPVDEQPEQSLIASTPVLPPEDDIEKKGEIASCFDFDEEDDGFIGMSDANTYGRKIPRVIPVKDKTDLGMDLEIEELFKKKSEVSDESGKGTEGDAAKPKKRGRPKITKTKTPAALSLASTRERRLGARKSYLNEVIQKVAEIETVTLHPREIEGNDVPKTLGREQSELEENLLVDTKETVQSEEDTEEGVSSKISQNNEEVTQEISTVSSLKTPEDLKDIPTNTPSLKEEVEVAEDIPSKIWEKKQAEEDIPLATSRKRSPDSEVEEDVPSKTSRRKQDLKRASLVELDDLNLIGEKKNITATARASLGIKKVKVVNNTDELASQVDLLLAETSSITLPRVPKVTRTNSQTSDHGLPSEKPLDASLEVDLSTVEYLEEEDSDKIESELEKSPPEKSWNDPDDFVRKSSVTQWQQDIRQALESNKEPTENKTVGETSESVKKLVTIKSANSVKPKGGIFYVVKQPSAGGRPKILGKAPGQQVMVVKSPRVADNAGAAVVGGQQRLRLLSTSSRLLSDKTGVKKLAISSKKLIQLKQSAMPQNIVLSGNGNARQGIRVVQNYNGSGKTVLIKEGSSSSKQTAHVISGQLVGKKLQSSAGGSEAPQYVIKRVKRPDGKFTIQAVSKAAPRSSTTTTTYVVPHQTRLLSQPDPAPLQQTMQIVATPQEEMTEPMVVETTVEEQQAVVEQSAAAATPQVVAMPGPPGPDGQPTYVLLTVDENGVMQAVNSSMMLAFETQGQFVSQQESGVETPSVYTGDILAEALANTNVLGDSDPLPTLMLPSVVQDSPHLIMAPPVVQETSVTLQKPIMTPVEVPSAVVADMSDLTPPPLPPTPTDDVLLEETDGKEHNVDGDFFIDDSQGEEPSSFHSMPLLTEESTASEEPIADQNFEPQSVCLEERTSEFLPTSTNPDLQEEQVKEGGDTADLANRSQETEVSSTTEETVS